MNKRNIFLVLLLSILFILILRNSKIEENFESRNEFYNETYLYMTEIYVEVNVIPLLETDGDLEDSHERVVEISEKFNQFSKGRKVPTVINFWNAYYLKVDEMYIDSFTEMKDEGKIDVKRFFESFEEVQSSYINYSKEGLEENYALRIETIETANEIVRSFFESSY